MSTRKRRLTTLGALGFGGYLMASAVAFPGTGQPVPDEVAGGLRGGVCQKLGFAPCAGVGQMCAAGAKVVAGTSWGQGSGDTPCGASCGSFFSSIANCASS
jgi:hypothetical protein